MSPEEKIEEKIEKLVKKYPNGDAALLPLLHLLQEEEGQGKMISRESMERAAKLLNVPVSRVKGVVSFYTMYNQKPVGKYFIQVCTNIACSILNSQEIVNHIEKKLGIKAGETTPDGKFTLITVECLGSCGTAPMMQINNDYYENLDKSRVEEILASLK